MSSYHGWTHAPKAQGGTDPIPEIVGAGADSGEYAYQEGGVLGMAADTWVRMVMVTSGKTGADGDPFTLVTDGISMVSGRYVVTGIVYWDGFAETGMIALGDAAGPDLFFRTELGPTRWTSSGSWNFIPVAGRYYPTVYLWALSVGGGNSNARLSVNELL